MDDAEKFLKGLLNIGTKQLPNKKQLKDPELDEAWINHLLGLKGPKRVQRVLSQTQLFYRRLFSGFNEIWQSHERLIAFEVYVGRFGYSGTSITKSQHLRYSVENYLQEMYILKERVRAYLTTVGRLYKNDPRHTTILATTKPLFQLVPKVFQNLIDARGLHVHQRRYDDDDLAGLERLSLWLKIFLSSTRFLGCYISLTIETQEKSGKQR